MSTTTTATLTPQAININIATRSQNRDDNNNNNGHSTAVVTNGTSGSEYRYASLLPHFSDTHYPPLLPFDHVDPGFRALSHSNPRSFLDIATEVSLLTPNLGTEVHGVNLATLSNDERDQLALEVYIVLYDI